MYLSAVKIIFLDIDGVLNVCYPQHDEHGRIFHPHFEDNLRSIVDATGAKIVLSSTWRMRGLELVKKLWSDRNLAGEVIGVTTTCCQLVAAEKFEYYDQVERGHEIQEWIDENPKITHYVILDDDNDMLRSQRGNFVRTANNINHPDCVDVGYGLTKICAEQAIRILSA